MDHQEKWDNEEEGKSWLENWNRRRHMAVAQVLCYVAYAVYLSSVHHRRDHRYISRMSLKRKKRKASEDTECRQEFQSIREAISNVAEAIREGNAIIESGQARIYSAVEVFTELMNMGFEQKTLYGAYIFLMADAVRVRAFFGCPVEERKNFLLQLMHAPPGFIQYPNCG